MKSWVISGWAYKMGDQSNNTGTLYSEDSEIFFSWKQFVIYIMNFFMFIANFKHVPIENNFAVVLWGPNVSI